MKAIQMPLWKGIFVIMGEKRKGSGVPKPIQAERIMRYATFVTSAACGPF